MVFAHFVRPHEYGRTRLFASLEEVRDLQENRRFLLRRRRFQRNFSWNSFKEI